MNCQFRSTPVPRRQQSRFTPYASASNRNRTIESNSASKNQELQERARPENNQDENQAVDMQVILYFFSNADPVGSKGTAQSLFYSACNYENSMFSLLIFIRTKIKILPFRKMFTAKIYTTPPEKYSGSTAVTKT